MTRCLIASLLLALGACSDDVPRPEASSIPSSPPLFEEITSSVGIDVRNEPGVDGSFFMPQIMGAGGALLDFDGDGDLDVYVVRGGTGTGARNVLYRQEGDGRFVDVSTASGLDDPGFGMGVAVGDFDNDGHVDVYVTNYGGDTLYRNEGDGTFTDVTAAAGIENLQWACSAAFVDYDRDGDLDLFVANYVHYPRPKVCLDQAGRPEFCGPKAVPPTADVLYRNEGDGRFADVSATSGIGAVRGRGLGVVCEDLDDDGWADIYVANDGEANFLWINRGDGTFAESAAARGVALNMFGGTEASMGIAVGDVDGDADPDLFMTHLVRESNTLYRNDGSGNFRDDTANSGLARVSFPLTGFGTAFLDYDNDGDLDLAIVNGRVQRGSEHRATDGATLVGYAEPNLLFRNDGAGLFTEVSDEAGSFSGAVEIGRGLVHGDIDGDGWVDLLVTNCNGPARLYRNTRRAGGRWLVVRAVDPAVRRDAYGARISVTAGGRTIHRTVAPASSYASSGDSRVHFGLGSVEQVDSVVVRWPDGQSDRLDAVAVDRIVTVERSASRDARGTGTPDGRSE